MRNNALPYPVNISSKKNAKEIFQQQRSRWTTAAVTFAIIGMIVGISGLVVSFLAYLEYDAYRKTNSRIGGLLTFAAFPLFLFAAHALDKITLIKRAERFEVFRNNEPMCRSRY